MRRGIKILVIVLVVLIILVLGYISFTIYQLTRVANAFQDKEFMDNIESLSNGDCSKLPLVEAKYAEVKSSLRSACWNPVATVVIQGYVKGSLLSNVDICAEMKNPNNQFESALNLAKTNCNILPGT